MDIYIHRIGRTCRTSSSSSSSSSSSNQGLAITLLTPHDQVFASHLVHYYQSINQPLPSPQLLSLSQGHSPHSQKGGNQGLGYAEHREGLIELGVQEDAFSAYFVEENENDGEDGNKEKKEKKNGKDEVVIETGSSLYETRYNPTTNTYTTTPIPTSTTPIPTPPTPSTPSIPPISSTMVAGFVACRQSRPVDSLPVSSYGGPDDEWDSSKMALESALAAIRAKRGERDPPKHSAYSSRERSVSHSSTGHSHHSYHSHHHSHSHSHHNHHSHSRSHSRSRSHSHSHSSRRYSHNHYHHHDSHNRRRRSRDYDRSRSRN